MSHRAGVSFLVLTLATLLPNCTSRPPQPVEIAVDEETCSHCRMAVSQREFAGEVVSTEGSVEYFDDIGCLARWVQSQQPPSDSGLFVVDYGTERWIDAATAYYSRSEQRPTPMGSGLAAFETLSAAQAASHGPQDRVLRWADLPWEDRR